MVFYTHGKISLSFKIVDKPERISHTVFPNLKSGTSIFKTPSTFQIKSKPRTSIMHFNPNSFDNDAHH
jgi:hypothetical protein